VPSIKILVVDDFERYRRFVCSLLRRHVECQIWEVSDGLEAVQRARELRPDLILLDIGLPGVNGIEAGRRIREVSANSRILYLSQESSADLVQEALQLGAQGYVLKADAADDLLLAVDAVLQGQHFLSPRFAAQVIGATSHELPAGPLRLRDRSPLSRKERETERFHEVVSCSDDGSFVDHFACFVETALQLGSPVIVVANESHRAQLAKELKARGWDLAAAIREGRYTSLDAGEILSTFMVNDWPDPAQLEKAVGNLVLEVAKRAKSKPSSVAVCGECAPTLLAQGKAEAAIEVEHLWDGLVRRYGFHLLCGYISTDSQIQQDHHIFSQIWAQHSAPYSL
jgi:DNA-binding NarL/FixJ family response regulator